MTDPTYQTLVQHYTTCFEAHGPTPKGVDWPREEDMPTRHRAMLDVIRPEDRAGCTLLDLGCGYGALLDFLAAENLPYDYRGIDLSEPMIHAAQTRHPNQHFEIRDILLSPLPAESVDYVVMNGVLTEKRSLSFDAMEHFAKTLIAAAFSAAKKGIAFNVMNAHVDWQRDDLFHWPFDSNAAFVRTNVSHHYRFRADYGLYEYTTYVYRHPSSR